MSELHEDLISIRKIKNISVDDIFDKTRMALESIHLIENGVLFNSNKNRTYIRSFARSYAKAIGVEEKDIVHALDLHEIGSYSGFLKEIYLSNANETVDNKLSETLENTSSLNNEEQLEIPIATDSKSEKKQESLFDFEDTPTQSSTSEEAVGAVASEKIEELKPLKTVSFPDHTSERKRINWSETNKKINSFAKKKSPLFSLLVIVLLILVLAALAYFFIFMNVSGRHIDKDIKVLSEAEVNQADVLNGFEMLDAPNEVQLPDTLEVHIYAAYGNLEPFRVRSDTFENRRPYWVQRGEAMRLLFIDEITLFNHRDRMLILYDNRVINVFAEENPSEQSVTIRREQFLKDPSLTSFTTSFPAEISYPTRVRERPVIVN